MLNVTEKQPLTVEAVKALLSQITGVSLVSVKEYTTIETGEVQNQLINVGSNFNTAKESDIEFLLNFNAETAIMEQARQELLKSLYIGFAVKTQEALTICADIVNENLKKAGIEIGCTVKDVQTHINRSKGQTDAYEYLGHGIKYNYNTEEFYIFGLQIREKTVIQDGEQKADKRSELTKAKDSLRRRLKHNKYRTFIVKNIYSLTAMGETLTIE